MAKIVTLGEIMLRLSTPLQQPHRPKRLFRRRLRRRRSERLRQLGQLRPPSVFRVESAGPRSRPSRDRTP
ncbi:MAG: hypothetical protein MZU97_26395 [Bacillus subtilis]|nr:hypothetical protein [Bacillus subtilis]